LFRIHEYTKTTCLVFVRAKTNEIEFVDEDTLVPQCMPIQNGRRPVKFIKFVGNYLLVGYEHSLELFFGGSFTCIYRHQYIANDTAIVDAIEISHPYLRKRRVVIVSFNNVSLHLFDPLAVRPVRVLGDLQNSGMLVCLPKHNFILTTTRIANGNVVLVDLMMRDNVMLIETVNIGDSELNQKIHSMVKCDNDLIASIHSASSILSIYKVINERSVEQRQIFIPHIHNPNNYYSLFKNVVTKTRSLFMVANRYLVHVYCYTVMVVDLNCLRGGATKVSYVYFSNRLTNAMKAYPIGGTLYFCVVCIGMQPNDRLTYININAATLSPRKVYCEGEREQVSHFAAAKCFC
jgi:hypothetical protein